MNISSCIFVLIDGFHNRGCYNWKEGGGRGVIRELGKGESLGVNNMVPTFNNWREGREGRGLSESEGKGNHRVSYLLWNNMIPTLHNQAQCETSNFP